MKKWEYFTYVTKEADKSQTSMYNELGNQRWEMVGFTIAPPSMIVAIFKREIIAKEGE